MPGRCTECGTYHYDGPPCDNCGEMGFTSAPKVMRCAECATIHIDEGPPCKDCGEMGFQRVQAPDAFLDRSPSKQPTNTGPSGEPEAFSSGDSGGRRKFLYGAGIVAVLGLGGYTLLTRDDYPRTTAPGSAEEASGIRFETVETELRGLINDRRESLGNGTVSTAGNVDAFATYYNKKYVKEGGGDFQSMSPETFDGEFNVSDYYPVSNYYGENYSGRAIHAFDSASELARDCFESWMSAGYDAFLESQYTEFGADVHVDEEGDIFLLVVVA